MTDTARASIRSAPDDPPRKTAAGRAPAQARAGVLIRGFAAVVPSRNARQAIRRRLRHQRPVLRPDRRRRRPSCCQAAVPREHRRRGNVQPNLSRILGPGSVFALDGKDHRAAPQAAHPAVPRQEHQELRDDLRGGDAARERRAGPRAQEFETLEPMIRITLNAILRAVFGADGANSTNCARIIPPWVTLGSRLAVLPAPPRSYGPAAARGAGWRSYRRNLRRTVFDRLIDKAKADPNFERARRHAGAAAAQHHTRTARRCRARTSPTSC